MYSRFDFEKNLHLINFLPEDLQFLIELLNTTSHLSLDVEKKQKSKELKQKLEMARMAESTLLL